MKNLFLIGLTALSVLLSNVMPASALDTALGFSLTTSNTAANIPSWIIVPSKANAAAVVQTIAGGTDLATAVVKAYTVDFVTTASPSTNYTTNIVCGTTNNIADGGVIIIQHKASDTYEKRTVAGTHAVIGALSVTVPPVGVVTNGDTIYHCSTNYAGQIDCRQFLANSTNFIYSSSAGALFYGQVGKPLLLELNGTSAAHLDLSSGAYVSPPSPPRTF